MMGAPKRQSTKLRVGVSFYRRKKFFHTKYPMMVFPSSILSERIICSTCFAENQRLSMRSSSMGWASPAVSSVARKIVIFSET